MADGSAMPLPVDAGARAAIEELLAHYAHAIGNDALETWPDFFVEDGQYLVTTRENHGKGWPIGIMYCDGRGMMQDRVTALRRAIVFEPHVYRHIVGSILIAAAPDGGYAVESHFHILRTNVEGATVTFATGRYLDEIVGDGGRMQFRKRSVILDSSRIDTLLVIPL
jgi:anthranilate 1,2-dioxygenase small subunit